MPIVEHRVRLDVPPERAWSACLEMLREPDHDQGAIARRLDPDPPAAGGLVVTTLRDGSGEREVHAVIEELEAPHRLATRVGEDVGAVRTLICLDPAVGGGTVVTLRNEAASGLPVPGRPGRLLDAVLLSRTQRQSARARLRRLRQLVAD
jgi:hypothetical protein